MIIKNSLFSELFLLSLVVFASADDYSKNDNDYYSVEIDGECTQINCPYPNLCSLNRCVCAPGLANYPFKGVDGKYCQYEQSKRKTILLLEYFLPIGIGHYIAGRYVYGLCKTLVAVIPWIILIMGYSETVQKKYANGNFSLVVSLISTFFTLTFFIWWIADCILLLLNQIRDYNRVPLSLQS